jgi:NADPH:quinone reductase-like Zn-dependent oxidoreductase
MKAVVFHEYGGPDRLQYEERPMPVVGPDEVLVRVKACALNHLDIWLRQGIPSYRISLPHISGCDVAGTVESMGDQAQGFSVGDPVLVSPGVSCWRCDQCLAGRDNFCQTFSVLGAKRPGGYAEYVSVPVRNLLPIPGSLTFEQAAAFPLVSVTAWHMLFTLAGLQPGETVLVMGAGSGVGSMAVQLAKLAGARVITTVGADEKIPKAVLLGADAVINHTRENVAERVKLLTEGRGADAVIEHIGPEVWDHCFKSLGRGGRLITCGATTGGEVKINLRALFARQITVRGSYVGTRAELVKAADLVGRGAIKPVIDGTYPLQEARAAQEQMLNRRFFGKIVLTVE